MNEKQRQASDLLVQTWHEVNAIKDRFVDAVNGLTASMTEEQISDIALSAFVRIVPDDEERKELIATVRDTAARLSPELPFRDIIMSALARAEKPRMSVVDGDIS